MSECHCDFKEDCCCQEEVKTHSVGKIVRNVLIVTAVVALVVVVVVQIRRR